MALSIDQQDVPVIAVANDAGRGLRVHQPIGGGTSVLVTSQRVESVAVRVTPAGRIIVLYTDAPSGHLWLVHS